MRHTLEKVQWDDVEAFFYEAMLAGWASGASVERSPDTGFKTCEHIDHERNLVLRDSWSHTRGSDWSAGQTVILVDSPRSLVEPEPIWIMQYAGVYKSSAAGAVQHALMSEYKSPRSGHRFSGCRGPQEFVHDGLTYRNEVHRGFRFSNFEGRESVSDALGRQLGWHRYSGLSLVL